MGDTKLPGIGFGLRYDLLSGGTPANGEMVILVPLDTKSWNGGTMTFSGYIATRVGYGAATGGDRTWQALRQRTSADGTIGADVAFVPAKLPWLGVDLYAGVGAGIFYETTEYKIAAGPTGAFRPLYTDKNYVSALTGTVGAGVDLKLSPKISLTFNGELVGWLPVKVDQTDKSAAPNVWAQPATDIRLSAGVMFHF